MEIKKTIGIALLTFAVIVGLGAVLTKAAIESGVLINGQNYAKSASIDAPLRLGAGADNSANTNVKKLFTIPARANAAAPSWTEGANVPLWVTLGGLLQVGGTLAVSGSSVAHDGAAAGVNPTLVGCYASAAAPSDVSADNDATRLWCLRNGALVFQSSYGGVLASAGAGGTGTGVPRVIEANDSQLSAGVGATGDAAVAAGATGSLTAKARLMTTLLDTISTAIASLLTSSQLIDDAISTIGSAPTTKANYVSGIGSGATGGLAIGIPIADSYASIDIVTATTTLVVTGVSGRHIRVAAMHLLTNAANNVAWISGTGATCGTGTAGAAGGTTAAEGYNFAAGSGITLGSGLGTVLKTIAAGDSLCLVTSVATQLSGSVSYAIF